MTFSESLRGPLLVLALLVATCVGGAAAAPAMGSGIDLRVDFETGDSSQLSGLECPHPATQFQVYMAGSAGYPEPRQGTYAARVSESPVDIWPGNNLVRCLGARYDSGETDGDDYWYGFSVYIPSTGLGDNLIWELHHPSALYSLPGCGVAPVALISRHGGLQFRLSTGNCTVGSGYAYWDPNIALPGLTTAPRSVWIDFLIHIAFSESSGTIEVSYRAGSDAWPSAPQLARHGIPTLPYATGSNVHDVSLYTELGLYTGYSPYDGDDSVFIDGYRRGTTRDAVMAEFPGSGSQAPTVSQSVTAGQTLRGVVMWTATPSIPVKRVVFAIDSNAITYADTTAPYTDVLDTTKLANGTHTFGLTVTLLDGTVVWQPYQVGTVTIANSAVVPPAVTAAPVLGGAVVDGALLTTTAGTWSNGPSAYLYAWQASPDGGATWRIVPSATSPTLTLTDALVGTRVRSVVTASNAAGAATSTSQPTAAVEPPVIAQSLGGGQTLRGVVTWAATPSVPVKRVVFAIDSNAITYADTTAPYTDVLDTTKLANGTHTFGLTVTLLDGTLVWQTYQLGTFTVWNSAGTH